MQHFQCIIIGGGLAGLSLSIQLAKKGYQVALLEKNTYPFHRVCGEYIAMESWNYLESCNIPLSQLNLPRITQLKVSSPNGKSLIHALNPGGFGISRFTLDNLLAKEAITCGVSVFTDCKVTSIHFNGDAYTVKSTKAEFTSNTAIGSFGKRSNLDIQLNRQFIHNKAVGENNYLGIKYHVKANLPSNVIELHNFENGYCGISKIENNEYCMCYLTNAKTLNKFNGNILKMEENVLFKNPYLKKYLTEFEKINPEPLVISQISFSNKTITENGILMIGDSAGLITPLCGNGMSMALHASKILSDLMPAYLNKEINKTQLEERYELLWRKHFKTRLSVGKMIQSWFGNPFLTNLLITLLKPFPFLVNKLVGLTHGKTF